MAQVNLDAARALIRDYHEYEGDRDISVIRRITHPDGGSVYLVHFTDRHGQRFSSLDMICLGASGEYATEFDSRPRAEESTLIARYKHL